MLSQNGDLYFAGLMILVVRGYNAFFVDMTEMFVDIGDKFVDFNR